MNIKRTREMLKREGVPKSTPGRNKTFELHPSSYQTLLPRNLGSISVFDPYITTEFFLIRIWRFEVPLES